MFRKILIANRGEIALRLIRACHAVGSKAVVVYSEADQHAPYLEEADEKICIGPGPASESYLNQDAILQAALQTEAQAIHPGFGFLAENARFAQRCMQQKLTFIGPSPSSMRLMGDKATARKTMAAAGLPVLPGSKELLTSVEEALRRAEAVGYPVLLKATAGGGGKGMRRVNRPEDLPKAFADASRESLKAFGDGGLYLEKYIIGGRHIEFQILADHYGNIIHLGERECSIQRNHQKLLEESPASGFSSELRQKMGALVRRAVAAVGYRNAGTVEFLMDHEGKLYFMEMNTRLQVEHPVTELVTGIDIAAWQMRIAADQPLTLKQEEITWNGHAIECRINAEDPSQNFRPSPGTILKFKAPKHDPWGPIRWDSHVREGYKIPPHYDSMIGKLIVHGQDRADAIQKMRWALDQFEIEGIPTTIDLHRKILSHGDFAQTYTCQFIPEHPDILS